MAAAQIQQQSIYRPHSIASDSSDAMAVPMRTHNGGPPSMRRQSDQHNGTLGHRSSQRSRTLDKQHQRNVHRTTNSSEHNLRSRTLSSGRMAGVGADGQNENTIVNVVHRTRFMEQPENDDPGRTQHYTKNREEVYDLCEQRTECIEERLAYLSNLQFTTDLPNLEAMYRQHQYDHRDIMDFRQAVDRCITRQSEISADDSVEYCDLLSILESRYDQLKEVSTQVMIDFDSLISFIRAAQIEAEWIHSRQEPELNRDWSDVERLDLPMLLNYHKQLAHEIELHEQHFNDVHNQGAALINQGHVASSVIEQYLRDIQAQWDLLMGLSHCLDTHLQDAAGYRTVMEEARTCEQWVHKQAEVIEQRFRQPEVTLDEGNELLQELKEISENLERYEQSVNSLSEHCQHISPMWKRGERIGQPLPGEVLCDYREEKTSVNENQDIRVTDNSNLRGWRFRSSGGGFGGDGQVPSPIIRLSPPDDRLMDYLNRLRAEFERTRRLWLEKTLQVRAGVLVSTMKTVQGWDLETFSSIGEDQRNAIVDALREDVNKLCSELPPNDPMAKRLRDELRRTLDHFANLMKESQRPPEPEYGQIFDEKMRLLMADLDKYWKRLNERIAQPLPRNSDQLQKVVTDHRAFEDSLQSLESHVNSVQQLFRQIPNPTAQQQRQIDNFTQRWEDLWQLSRAFVNTLKSLDLTINGIDEVAHIIKQQELILASYENMPADLDLLRTVHSQILEMDVSLQQKQPVMDELARHAELLQVNVIEMRPSTIENRDMAQYADDVQKLSVRWENVCAQVLRRLKLSEAGLQHDMIYRSEYDIEIQWLNRLEQTVKQLRSANSISELQDQLDCLNKEYQQLQQRTEQIEHVNQEGGSYILEAKTYDTTLNDYEQVLVGVHGSVLRSMVQRNHGASEPGHQIVRRELDELNRRFSTLISFIVERRSELEQTEKQKRSDEQQRELDQERARQNAERQRQRDLDEEERRRREAEQEAERRRREAEAEAERKRLAAQRAADAEAERKRLAEERAKAERDRLEKERERQRQLEAERARQRQKDLDDAQRRQREQDERRRKEEADRRKRDEEDEEAARKRREAEAEAERLRLAREAAEKERQRLQQAAEDAERLKKENAQHQQAMRSEQDEIDRLRAELDKVKAKEMKKVVTSSVQCATDDVIAEKVVKFQEVHKTMMNLVKTDKPVEEHHRVEEYEKTITTTKRRSDRSHSHSRHRSRSAGGTRSHRRVTQGGESLAISPKRDYEEGEGAVVMRHKEHEQRDHSRERSPRDQSHSHQTRDYTRGNSNFSDSLRRGEVEYMPNGELRTSRRQSRASFNRDDHYERSSTLPHNQSSPRHANDDPQPIVEFPPTLPRSSHRNGGSRTTLTTRTQPSGPILDEWAMHTRRSNQDVSQSPPVITKTEKVTHYGQPGTNTEGVAHVKSYKSRREVHMKRDV